MTQQRMDAAVTGRAPAYPPAPRTDLVEEVGGVEVADPYRRLEDHADPSTVAWTAAQDDLFAAWKAAVPEIGAWRTRLSEAFAITVASVPKHRGTRVFRTVRRPYADHAVLLVREAGEERVVLDPAALDSTGGTVLEAWEPSPDGALIAVQLSVGGTEDCLLRVLDVRDGRVVDGPVDRVRRTPVAWQPDGAAFYYVRRLAPELVPGEERYHRRVYRHTVGTDPAADVMVFGEGRDRTQFYGVAVTADGRWLIVSATAGADPRTELWLADLSESPPALRRVPVGGPSAGRLWIGPDTPAGGPMWLRTDFGAPRGRVMVATVGEFAPDRWRELIPERPDAVLDDFATLHDRSLERPLGLAVWTRRAVSEVTVHEAEDRRHDRVRADFGGRAPDRLVLVGALHHPAADAQCERRTVLLQRKAGQPGRRGTTTGLRAPEQVHLVTQGREFASDRDGGIQVAGRTEGAQQDFHGASDRPGPRPR
jgi:prolyl oligopeptidase